MIHEVRRGKDVTEQNTGTESGRVQPEDCGQVGTVPELLAIKVPAVGVGGARGWRGAAGSSLTRADGLGLGGRSL